MKFDQHLKQILHTLKSLDTGKKAALGILALVLIGGVALFSALINQPGRAPLYANLSQEDLNSMSRVLSENGIGFAVSQERNSIDVEPVMVAHARMLLAERGLPSSQESGYELFDKMNTLGLTSFMQDVTNKRAIEGELARTIQMISGVNSARVHLVLRDKNVYRRRDENPTSASVVLKTVGKLQAKSIDAIRHMVAAGVPGLASDSVTIIGTDGSLLTNKGDAGLGASNRLVELEREFNSEAEAKIAAALGAHLGGENFRVSVTSKLNIDQRRVDETVYDPNSRVERSVQVVRENGSTENKESSAPTTIEQNLPEEDPQLSSGQSSTENSERREELTNYEINEKKISVLSDGYQVETLSVAMVVNKARIEQLLGPNAGPSDMQTKIAELEAIVASAISASAARGDTVTVSLVEFLPSEVIAPPAASSGMAIFFSTHFNAILNAVGLIIGALILSLLGIRPLIAFLQQTPGEPQLADASSAAEALPEGVTPGAEIGADGAPQSITDAREDGFSRALAEMKARETKMREQVETLVGQGEERAAQVIKHWLKEDRIKAT